MEEPVNALKGNYEISGMVGSEDVAIELQGSSFDKDIRTNVHEISQINNEEFQFKGNGKKNDQRTLLNHAKFLESFESTQDKDGIKYFQSNLAYDCKSKKQEEARKWFQRNKKCTKKEMLKISFESLEKYFAVLSKKIEEISFVSDNLKFEKSKSVLLQNDVKQFELKIADMTKALDEMSIARNEENKQYKFVNEELRAKMDAQGEKWHQEMKAIELEYEECRRRKQLEMESIVKERKEQEMQVTRLVNNLKREKEENEMILQKQIEYLKERITDAKKDKEKAELQIAKMNDENKNKNENAKEIERLEFLLKRKQAENINLSEKLMTVEQECNLSITNLREEILFKDTQLIEVKERYENQLKIVQLFEKTFSEKETHVDVPNTKCNRCIHEELENLRDVNDRVDEKFGKCRKSKAFDSGFEKSTKNHQHFIDSMMNHSLEGKVSTSATKADSIQKFAVLKVEDIWEEQILCHESNVEKLKEMQSLRKSLITTREQLEKAIEENLELKNSIKNDAKVKKNRWKELLNKQIFEMQRKEDQIDNLKLELLKNRQEVNSLSKQLRKCMLIQKGKEKEIQLLNVTVKTENGEDYCCVTMESMRNFEMHIRKLREENKYLLRHCDKVEERVNELQKETHIGKKINNELAAREKMLEESCADLKSEVNSKNSCLRKLKETLRDVQKRYEDGKEEIKDKNYEVSMYKNKLKKMEKRQLEMDDAKKSAECENSVILKKSLETERDLQKSLDMVYQMKLRYENVEEKFKEQEENINKLSDDLILKENEIKSLNGRVKILDSEKESLLIDLEDLRRHKDEWTSKLESKTEKYRDEINEFEMKIGSIEEDLSKERKECKERQKEIDQLKTEIKEYEHKMMNMVGQSDLDFIQNELSEMKNENELLKEEMNELENEKKEVGEKLEILHTDNEELNSRSRELQNEINQLFDELKEKDKEMVEKENLLKDLKENLEAKSRDKSEENTKLERKSNLRESKKEVSSKQQVSKKDNGNLSHPKSNYAGKGDSSGENKDEKRYGSKEIDLSSNSDLDLGGGYVPSTAEKEGDAKREKKQNKPSWLFSADSKEQTTLSANEGRNAPAFDDALDELFEDTAAPKQRNEVRRSRHGKELKIESKKEGQQKTRINNRNVATRNKQDDGKHGSMESLEGLFSDGDFDLGGGYVPTVAEKKIDAKMETEKKKPSWLFSENSNDSQVRSSSKKSKNESMFDDSLDDFVLNEKKPRRATQNINECDVRNGNSDVGKSSPKKVSWLMRDKEKEKKSQNNNKDFIDYEGWNEPPTNRQRRRGQSGEDAASELKKLTDFGF